MQDQSDAQLLRDYAAHGSEPAFAGIVARHTDLVYSAAWRQTGSPELAREIAQTVFTDLARKARALAGGLTPDASLTGWLYRSTRYEVLTVLRDERRRQAHARLVMEHFNPASDPAPDWQQIAPVLDEAMAELGDADREAVLLRYFQNQDFHAVGRALGVSDDTAQKRVSRAVERLREFLGKRGVTLGAQGLVVLAANAVQAAPAGLSAALAATALAGTTVITTATATVGKAIAMTTTQKVLVTAVLAAAVGTGIYEARDASNLRAQVQTLQQQIPGDATVASKAGNDEAAQRQNATLRADNERLTRDNADLLRLRAEVTRLRDDAKALAEIKSGLVVNTNNDRLQFIALMWAKDTKALKDRLAQMPQYNIPEIALLDDFAWLRIGQNVGDIHDDDEVRENLSYLREEAKKEFAQRLIGALWKYSQTHDGQIPQQMLDLKPFVRMPKDKPLDDDVFQRYELAQTGKLADAPRRELIVEKTPADPDNDTLFKMGLDGYSYRGVGRNAKSGTGEGNFSRAVREGVAVP